MLNNIYLRAKRRFAPNHFEILSETIATIAADKHDASVRVIDLGAGAARYWSRVAQEVQPIKIDLTLLDATKPDSLPELLEGKVQHTRGLIPESLIGIPKDSFDLAVSFDLIEHLPKEDGYRMMYAMERIASAACIVFGPTGFVWQPPSENNPHNAHISEWWPKEFKAFGYKKITGHAGMRNRTDEYGIEKPYGTGRIGAIINLIIGIFVANRPNSAFAFSAVKYDRKNAIPVHEGVTNS